MFMKIALDRKDKKQKKTTFKVVFLVARGGLEPPASGL